MPTNEFLPFATAPGAGVDTQDVWASSSGYRPQGYGPGVLTKGKLNKALRQSSSIAAALAQLLVNALDEDVRDDGDLDNLVDQLTRAIPTLPTFATMGDQINGMMQPFTGAVLRTQRAKNAEWVSVKDFGAVGDGNTDDRLAIQRAHDASLHVFYPDGYYKVFGRINVRVGTDIDGASAGGTVIIQGADYSGELDAVFECAVPAASFDSQQAGITVSNISILGDNHFGHGFKLQNIRFPMFYNVWIRNFNGSALLLDYAEEGHFTFCNINDCGRTAGNPSVTADTTYGQITFHRSSNAVAGVSSNFLRFNGLTLANGKCSGDIMIKAGSPSRIFFNDCQSELSGSAIQNRDWFIARSNGGIFWFNNNDVVNYRNCFDNVHFVELYAKSNRVTNCVKYYYGANGTGQYVGSGNRTNGMVDYTSVAVYDAVNDAYGAASFQYLFAVSLNGCRATNLTVNDLSASPSLLVTGCTFTGNVTMGNFVYNGTFSLNTVAGTATLAGVMETGNTVTGVFTRNAATVSPPRKALANATADTSMSLPTYADMIFVNGTTTISAIANPAPFAGRTVTLVFNNNVTLQRANNLLIASTFNATPDDTITLTCDGTNFRENSRVVI